MLHFAELAERRIGLVLPDKEMEQSDAEHVTELFKYIPGPHTRCQGLEDGERRGFHGDESCNQKQMKGEYTPVTFPHRIFDREDLQLISVKLV